MKLILSALLLTASTAFAAGTKTSTTTNTTTSNESSMMEATQLDDLVRGELAAIKSYDAALADIKDGKEKTALQAIRKDHDRASAVLSKYVQGKKDLLEDTEEAGAWGTFAKTWVKGAGLMGNKTALKALQQGEEHGVDEYNEALEDKNISADLKAKIKAELLPNQKKHIETLKQYM